MNRKKIDKRITVLFAIGFVAIAISGFLIYTGAIYKPASPEGIPISASDIFSIPEYNSTIIFPQGGKYSNSTYNSANQYSESRWRFTDLCLGNSRFTPDIGRYLVVTAKNCSMSITGYDIVTSGSNQRNGWLNYTLEGAGTQTVYFGGALTDMTVSLDGVARSQNDGWTITHDYYIAITDAHSTVSIRFNVALPVPA
jgi:hypothetical protein